LGFGVGLGAGETEAAAICGDDDAAICGDDDAAICGDDDAATNGVDDAAISGEDDAAVSGGNVVADATGEGMPPSGAADAGGANAEGELSAVPPLGCEPVQELARKRHAIAATVVARSEAAGDFNALDPLGARRTQ
jgi:hypothetical protein